MGVGTFFRSTMARSRSFLTLYAPPTGSQWRPTITDSSSRLIVQTLCLPTSPHLREALAGTLRLPLSTLEDHPARWRNMAGASTIRPSHRTRLTSRRVAPATRAASADIAVGGRLRGGRVFRASGSLSRRNACRESACRFHASISSVAKISRRPSSGDAKNGMMCVQARRWRPRRSPPCRAGAASSPSACALSGSRNPDRAESDGRCRSQRVWGDAAASASFMPFNPSMTVRMSWQARLEMAEHLHSELGPFRSARFAGRGCRASAASSSSGEIGPRRTN